MCANKERGLNASKGFKVSQLLTGRAPFESIVDTRWVPTWEIVSGNNEVAARSVAKGYQGPHQKDGLAEISGRVSLRSSRHRVISLGALKNGDFGAWPSKMLFRQQTTVAATNFSAPTRNGLILAPAAFGNCKHRHMV